LADLIAGLHVYIHHSLKEIAGIDDMILCMPLTTQGWVITAESD